MRRSSSSSFGSSLMRVDSLRTLRVRTRLDSRGERGSWSTDQLVQLRALLLQLRDNRRVHRDRARRLLLDLGHALAHAAQSPREARPLQAPPELLDDDRLRPARAALAQPPRQPRRAGRARHRPPCAPPPPPPPLPASA